MPDGVMVEVYNAFLEVFMCHAVRQALQCGTVPNDRRVSLIGNIPKTSVAEALDEMRSVA